MRLRAHRHRAGYPAENKGDCCERSRVLRGKGGFSLIEVMISASILAVSLLGIAAIFPVAYLNVDSGGKQTEASALSQSFIEELRTLAVIDPANFDAVVGNFPAGGFNGMNTANCQGNQICINWRNTLNFANGGQLAQGVGTVTMTCQDGAGNGVPLPPPNDDCTGGSQPTWIATVNVTVTYSDARQPNRTVTLATRIMRP